MIRTYSELIQYSSFEDRYEYLALKGRVGEATFGYDRWINQKFYTGRQWRDLRNYIVVRDDGCDLGIAGREIPARPIVHHMNPLSVDDLVQNFEDALDPEYLVLVSHRTHNAIHYGDRSLLLQDPVVRRPGDTKLW